MNTQIAGYGEPAIAVQMDIHFLAAGKCEDLLTAAAKLASRIESFGSIDFEVSNPEKRLLSKGKQIIIVKKKNKNLP